MAKKNIPTPKQGKFNFYWIYGIIAVVLLGSMLLSSNVNTIQITNQDFNNMAEKGYIEKVVIVKNKGIADIYLKKDKIEDVKALDKKFKFLAKKPKSAFSGESADLEMIAPPNAPFYEKLEELHKEYGLVYDYEEKYSIGDALGWMLFPALLIIFWIFMFRRMGSGGGGAGGGIFSIGKSRAKVFEKGKGTNVTFKDVAGLEGAKEEVEEIVDFLKNPKTYTELGAKIPKGALLVGPPGTGKTLLAKAVAGEAKVPFFSLSGSDFVEMFVGVGASRVRDLFKQAKEKAPSIIFIDEIDAIGRARGKNAQMGSNDERENTLNQLLTEMDGFGTNSGVIILAATNRADVLDSALMRAGRFDRQIYVDMPDLNERKEIFMVHLKPLKLKDNLDIDFLARQTPGFSGADIANLCNESALIAARKKRKHVELQDFLDAVDRIVGGLEKKNKIITPHEKKTIAYHEAGHATTSWLLEHASPLVKVTIVPRGKSLGAAWYLPEERQITTKEQLLDEMCSALGGRASEKIIFGKISTGALSDLEKVTKQAYAMVSMYGLSDKVGNISYYDSQGQQGFTKPYSEETARIIDEEVSVMIEEQYKRAIDILSKNKEKLAELAEALLKDEVIFKENLIKIFGKRPWDKAETVSEEIIQEEKEFTQTHETDNKVNEETPSENKENHTTKSGEEDKEATE